MLDAPHSLGKLIEWKQIFPSTSSLARSTPHSLGKLIEWKLLLSNLDPRGWLDSPLAGETNWMETYPPLCDELFSKRSPLAGETNWMETYEFFWWTRVRSSSSPLAGETNWMETIPTLGWWVIKMSISPLAGETNWMETFIATIYSLATWAYSSLPTRWGN